MNVEDISLLACLYGIRLAWEFTIAANFPHAYPWKKEGGLWDNEN